jgi:hypothetical protein
MAKECFCPNCGGPAKREGRQVVCEKCDAVFEVNKKNEAKVKQVSPLAALEHRVSKIEDLLGPEKPDDEPGDQPDADDEPESEAEDLW